MTLATVTPLRSSKTARQAKSRATVKRYRRQSMTATAVGLLACTLTGLSLAHLAEGITIVTNCPSWQGWAMAVGIDLSYIGLELSQVCAATDSVRKAISRFAKPTVIGTLAWSAIANAFAFAAHIDDWRLRAAAILLGVSIPALIYSTTRVAAGLYIDCHSKG